MKRFLGALFLSVILAKTAFAVTTIPWTKEGCESVKGTWITAHSAGDSGCDAAHCTGQNFCKSNVAMNWFSAVIWCQSIGRQLADIETACPKGLSSGTTCANLKGYCGTGGDACWTSSPCGQKSAYQVESRYTIWCDDYWIPRTSVTRALCK